MKNRVFLKAYLWSRFWTIVGVVFLIVVGPNALGFPPPEKWAIIKVGLIAAAILVATFSVFTAKLTLPLRKINEIKSKEEKKKIAEFALKIPDRFLVMSFSAFAVGSLVVMLGLYHLGLASGLTTTLGILWGIGTGLGVGWIVREGMDLYLEDIYKALNVRSRDELAEIEAKNLDRRLVTNLLPSSFFVAYFLALTIIGSTKYTLREKIPALIERQSASYSLSDNSYSKLQLIEGMFTKNLTERVVFMGLLMFVLVSVAPLVKARMLRKYISKLENGLDEFRNRNLDIQVPVVSGDEIGVLTAGFNDMVVSMRELVAQIKDASLLIASSLTQIHQSLEEQAAVTSEQSAAISEISSAAEELAQSASEMDEMIEKLAQMSRTLLEVSEKGGAEILKVLEYLEELSERIEEISESVRDLERKSEKIGEITEIIKSISDETHLLSINAAIEASAAGEFGRRFSVVASEVRRLAEDAKEATGEINKIMDSVRNGVSRAVFATEKGLKVADEAREKASTAREALKVIQEKIEEGEGFTQRIKLSTSQQKTAINQVALSIKEVATAMERAASSISQIESALKNMKETAGNLQKKVEEFRYSNGEREVS